MLKRYKHIMSFAWAFIVLLFIACTNDDNLLSGDGENVSFTFHPVLCGASGTRAIGDATGIDRLQVVVYEDNGTSLSKKFSLSETWTEVQRYGITLTLIEDRKYKILFWADDEDNLAYDFTVDGKVSVDYTSYIGGGFAKMEEMDAFCATSSIKVGAQKVENKGEIKLSRPFAQLNFADNATQPVTGTHKTVVTFHSIPTSFNPFSGEVEMSSTSDIAFIFTDFPTEPLSVNGLTYYYLSSNYLFAPQEGTVKVSATIDLQNIDGTSIKTVELSEITLEKNKKTNVTGSIVQQLDAKSIF